MKIKWYHVIPAVAFVLILANAFFGHLVFSSPYNQDINKYSIYVHFQPEWNSYPRNLIFDITNVWNKENSEVKFIDDYKTDYNSINSSNSNELHYIKEKSFVELKHGFSDCQDSWRPILYRYGIDTLRSQLEFLQGRQLNTDPYISKFSIMSNSNYGLDEQKNKLNNGFVGFIPICTSHQNTNYEYSVRIDDERIAFNVYFVKSKDELTNFISNSSQIDYYAQEGCYGKNYVSFNGQCNNVGLSSGLLIAIPDELNKSLTKISIILHEIN